MMPAFAPLAIFAAACTVVSAASVPASNYPLCTLAKMDSTYTSLGVSKPIDDDFKTSYISNDVEDDVDAVFYKSGSSAILLSNVEDVKEVILKVSYNDKTINYWHAQADQTCTIKQHPNGLSIKNVKEVEFFQHK